MSHEKLGWEPITTKGNPKPQQLAEELARQSLLRMDKYLGYYYTSYGEMREMAAPEGNFVTDLKSGVAIIEECKAQFPFLLPEG